MPADLERSTSFTSSTIMQIHLQQIGLHGLGWLTTSHDCFIRFIALGSVFEIDVANGLISVLIHLFAEASLLVIHWSLLSLDQQLQLLVLRISNTIRLVSGWKLTHQLLLQGSRHNWFAGNCSCSKVCGCDESDQ